MKKTITRLCSLLLAMITAFGLSIAPASAAGISNSDSTYTVSVNTGGADCWKIITTNNAKLRTKASAFASVYATYTKGTLIQIDGSTEDWYRVKMGGSHYWISRSDCKNAGKTFKANIDYAIKDKCAVRSGPSSKSGVEYKMAKGTAFILLGSLRNDDGNLWMVMYDTTDKKPVYCFSDNCKKICTQVILNVNAADTTVNTNGTLRMHTSYTPSALTNSISWSSSNTSVATVSKKGLVTGVSAGKVTITATVNGLCGEVSVSIELTVSPKISYDVPVLRQTDSRWKDKKLGNSRATIGGYGCTLTCLSMLHSFETQATVTPDVMASKYLKFNGSGCVVWQSVKDLGYTVKSYKKVNLAGLYELLKDGPVIIGGKNSKTTHWVIITSFNGSSTSSFKASQFGIIDPGNKNRTDLQDYLDSYPTVTSLVY